MQCIHWFEFIVLSQPSGVSTTCLLSAYFSICKECSMCRLNNVKPKHSIWGGEFRIELFSLHIITSSGITGRALLLLEDPQVAPFLPTLAPPATEAPELPCTVPLLPAAPTEEGRRCTDHRRRCTTPGRGRRTTEAKLRLIQAWKTAQGLQDGPGHGIPPSPTLHPLQGRLYSDLSFFVLSLLLFKSDNHQHWEAI